MAETIWIIFLSILLIGYLIEGVGGYIDKSRKNNRNK